MYSRQIPVRCSVRLPGLLFGLLSGLLTVGLTTDGLITATAEAQQQKLPPAPALPELTDAARKLALTQLTDENYHLREQSSQQLMQGGMATVAELPAFAAATSVEGKVRTLEIAQQVYLKLLRLQYDDEALAVREWIEEIRQQDEPLLGKRAEIFQTIHHGLLERASIRSLVRLNAVLDFQPVKRIFPGISKHDFTTELPRHIFIGENWLGNDRDLRHIEYLLELGETQFGSYRVIYRIQGCPVPLETFEELATGLPGVSVEERSRARLGIQAENPSLLADPEMVAQWSVSQVQAGSSAAHAGLRRGDVLLRLNGKIINTFRELTIDLENYKPPDRVILDVLREGSDSRKFETTAPASLEELGLTIDPDFRRFALVQSVTPDSLAEKMGLNNRMRVEFLNGQPIRNAETFERVFARIEPGSPLALIVREATPIPVILRGWVGSYR